MITCTKCGGKVEMNQPHECTINTDHMHCNYVPQNQEIDALRAHIAELEKQLAEACHIITTGYPTDRTEYCRANAPNESSQDCCKRCCIDAIKAYLPAPPEEVINAKD